MQNLTREKPMNDAGLFVTRWYYGQAGVNKWLFHAGYREDYNGEEAN